MIAVCMPNPSGPAWPFPTPWRADESPLNDLDDAEEDIAEVDGDVADALAELLDERAPLADPGTP
jgi:hypothetical protein